MMQPSPRLLCTHMHVPVRQEHARLKNELPKTLLCQVTVDKIPVSTGEITGNVGSPAQLPP